MKICIAQIKSVKGNVNKNIENHIQFIDRAIKLNSDIIVFPELSLTNYEPQLANELATEVGSSIFNPFQKLSDENKITICLGMPTITDNGIHISMIIFQAYKKREVYSKQLLHSDEEPFFTCGAHQTYIEIKNYKIAFGICYESLQREHFLEAKENSADIYIASVAKPQHGIDKACKHFSEISQEFATPILMSNAIGQCDNFLCAGQSAVWNNKGELIYQLDAKNQGLLVYDIKLDSVLSEELVVTKNK